MTDEQTGLVGREFRHFKGNRYRLEGFAKDPMPDVIDMRLELTKDRSASK